MLQVIILSGISTKLYICFRRPFPSTVNPIDGSTSAWVILEYVLLSQTGGRYTSKSSSSLRRGSCNRAASRLLLWGWYPPGDSTGIELPQLDSSSILLKSNLDCSILSLHSSASAPRRLSSASSRLDLSAAFNSSFLNPITFQH